MFIFGLGFSVYTAVIWSSVHYIVDKNIAGTGYGIFASIYNLTLVVVPILVGYIQSQYNNKEGYFWVSILFIILGFFGILNTIVLYFVNLKDKKTLIL